MLFSPAGSGFGELSHARFEKEAGKRWRDVGLFVNRTIPDWYEIDGPAPRATRKGGAVDFLLTHPNPIAATMALATWDRVTEAPPIWGWALKEKMARHFREFMHLKFETFTDWMPLPDCRVVLDPDVRDKWGTPSARLRLADHPSHVEVPTLLCERAAGLLRRLGAEEVRWFADGSPSTNLQAGGCRFGKDPKASVLDPDCRAHDVDNLFVTDGSFLPTGGSVPYTFTIYANALRVSEKIVAQLGGRKAR
jgi:choline dehydrogenase-like flavoprotein